MFLIDYLMSSLTLVSDVSDEERAKLEKDKIRIMQDKSIAEGEKQKLLQETEQKLSQIKKEEAKKMELTAKIKVISYFFL